MGRLQRLPRGRPPGEGGRQAVCPHWLGGGIGLVASLHLKAAVGGAGFVEVDANDNPLRDALGRPLPAVRDSRVTLDDGPGLGVEPDIAGLAAFRIDV